MSADTRREYFPPERALAFSDGIFAVAITLLVIDLRLPPDLTDSNASLLHALRSMQPKVLIFAFTFVVLGMVWLAHHRKFSYVRQVDRNLLWLNLLFLLTLCLVPFATSVWSGYKSQVGFILYDLTMMALLALSGLLSAYCLREPFIIEGGLHRNVRQDMVVPPFVTAALFLISAGLASVGRSSLAGWILLLIVPTSTLTGVRARKA